ncbi:sensor domain-containing diguanylate cyclase [Gorillibacterium timonense]|uniref:sensor domain-containing diguanylate cyclase n=1 Tax=Gorillibacterium timonense TaxID=1689269 RepID=UPI00071DF0F7|nr:sensor domain-containing diguanylate cyclase [Gorillibacterium timonense]
MEDDFCLTISDRSGPGGNGSWNPLPTITIAVEDLADAHIERIWIEGFHRWVEHSASSDPAFRGWLMLAAPGGEPLSLCVIDGLPVFYAPSEAWMLESAGEAMDLALSAGQSRRLVVSASLSALPVQDRTGALAAVIGAHSAADSKGSFLTRMASLFPLFIQLESERLRNLLLTEQLEREESLFLRKETLYRSIEKLFSLIDVERVLSEAIFQIQEMFPESDIDLLLCQDESGIGLPVKPLNIFDVNNELCMHAFMEGKVIPAASTVSGFYPEIAAPLIGKQGAYGVLHLRAKATLFTSEDCEVVGAISTAAGTAFENGKLYEQSNILVNELRLINELTKRLNQSLRLGEIFDYAMSELLHIFDADYCCILQENPGQDNLLVRVCNLPEMTGELIPRGEGYSGVVFQTKEPVIESDYAKSPPIRSELMEMTGCRSLIASPIFMNGEVVGVILVTHRNPYFFTYENYKLLSVLAGPIGLAIANASLHAEVRRMVITDNLTGLFTRKFLDDQVSQHQEADKCGSLIVVDIDDFKRVNDTLGHQIGDKVLIQVSEITRSCIRESDIAARWGGEELAIYLPHVAVEQAMNVAERIRNRVNAETNPGVTVSCGVSDWSITDEKVSVELLFYRSDMALYKAKRAGKNQIKTG